MNNGNQTKKESGAILGVTQALSKDTIMQVNYGISHQIGYLTDPYKGVSLTDDIGNLLANFHEARPNSRTGHNLYISVKHSLPNKDVITTSMRLHTDDWGINSLTGDIKYRYNITKNHSIEPHLRYYKQSAADFSSYTIGATYRWRERDDRI